MQLTRPLIGLTIALTIAAASPAGLAAQETKADSVARVRADSLEARIRELEARLDSLLAALARGERADSAARSAADELAALRAAARAAAGEQQEADTTSQSRTRNLSILNPEISITGDVLGQYLAPSGEDNRFTAVPREFEFAFEAALDPYTRTKIFAAYEEEVEIAGLGHDEEEAGDAHSGFHIEEGYLYWVGLPANLGLKIGKFRQEIGLFNRWHTHALLEVDRPLPTVAFLGDDGLIETGLSLAAPPVLIGANPQTLTVEIATSKNEALFDDGNRLAFLGNFRSFWDLSPATYLQLGASAVYGENPDGGLKSTLFQVDFLYRWRPPGRALYRDLRIGGEYYFARKDYGDPLLKGNGGYLQGNYRFARRWVAGLRFDYLDDYGNEPKLFMLVPTLTWWQSEWVYLRLQYNYLKPDGGGGNHTVTAQVVWAVGPHKHENY
jgi:hypothetical protein